MMIELQELFTPIYGVNLEYNKMVESTNGIPFVARTSQNNGVVGYVEKIDGISPNPAMTISLSASGSVMESFFQEKEYYSGRDLYYLKPKIKLTHHQMLYYCMILRANKYRYSFGRQANKTLRLIKIPYPDEMPNYVTRVNIQKPNEKPFLNKKLVMSDRKWKFFDLSEIFNIKLGIPVHKDELEQGIIPYITRTATNNGVENLGGSKYINAPNAITIGAEGYKAFYQPNYFITGNKITILRSSKINKLNAMFVCRVLDEILLRYNYGYAAVSGRIKKLKIKLPFSSEEEPDWQFMEDYIKSLPYSSNLK